MQVSQVDVEVVADRIFPDGFHVFQHACDASADFLVNVELTASDWEVNVETSVGIEPKHIRANDEADFVLRL